MITALLAAVVVTLAGPPPVLAEPPQETSVDIVSSAPPQLVRARGHDHLLYELRLTNLGQSTRDLTELDVLGDKGQTVASFRGAALHNLLVAIGGPPELAPKAHALAGGRAVEVFLDLTLPADAPAPVTLHHHLVLAVSGKDGEHWEERVTGAPVHVNSAPLPLLEPPLRGAGWVAANGLSNPAHRRALVTIDGATRIAQRFAIDWVKLGPDGRLYHGAPDTNANYYGYGAEVLAVADGVVTEIKDGIPQNAGNNPKPVVAITLETIAGNHLILDLGGGRFAVYAHLQPGSFKVKLGERVKTGQVLAKLGNTGHSDAPHLHFQVVDSNSNLAAEGVPYALRSFTQLGVVPDLDALLRGQTWRADPRSPADQRRDEFPMDDAVVAFP